jgi:quercetin dioxygenase-like cupin family protein
MSEPLIAISSTGNVWTRMMHFVKAGDVEIGHSHQFDHATLLSKGSISIRANGKDTVFTAPHLIWIKKELVHELTALEDGTVCACIHALRGDMSSGGDIISPDMVPDGVEPNP